jgi:hypothetical protein
MDALKAEEIAIEYAKSTSARIRANAAVFLTQLKSAKSQSQLRQLMEDSDPYVRNAALSTLLKRSEGVAGARMVRLYFSWSVGPSVALAFVSLMLFCLGAATFVTLQMNSSEPPGGWVLQTLGVTIAALVVVVPLAYVVRPTGLYAEPWAALVLEAQYAAYAAAVTAVLAGGLYFVYVDGHLGASIAVAFAATAIAISLRLGAAFTVLAVGRRRPSASLVFCGSLGVAVPVAILAISGLARSMLFAIEDVGRLVVFAAAAVVCGASVLADCEKRAVDLGPNETWPSLGLPAVAKTVMVFVFLGIIGAVLLSVQRTTDNEATIIVNGVARHLDGEIVLESDVGAPLTIELKGANRVTVTATHLAESDIVGVSYDDDSSRKDVDEDPAPNEETITQAQAGDPRTLLEAAATSRVLRVCFELYDSEDPCPESGNAASLVNRSFDSVLTQLALVFVPDATLPMPGTDELDNRFGDLRIRIAVAATNEAFAEARAWFAAAAKPEPAARRDRTSPAVEATSFRVVLVPTDGTPGPGITLRGNGQESVFDIIEWPRPPPAIDEIDFGSDSGEYLRDEDCDDSRFGGGLTGPPRSDASDCRRAFQSGAVSYHGYTADSLSHIADGDEISATLDRIDCDAIRNVVVLLSVAYSWRQPGTLCDAQGMEDSSLGFVEGLLNEPASRADYSNGDLALAFRPGHGVPSGALLEVLRVERDPTRVVARAWITDAQQPALVVLNPSSLIRVPPGSENAAAAAALAALGTRADDRNPSRARASAADLAAADEVLRADRELLSSILAQARSVDSEVPALAGYFVVVNAPDATVARGAIVSRTAETESSSRFDVMYGSLSANSEGNPWTSIDDGDLAWLASDWPSLIRISDTMLLEDPFGADAYDFHCERGSCTNR